MVIAVDMDDTIENLLCAWVPAINKKFGTSVNPDDITTWELEHYFPSLTTADIVSILEDNDFWSTVTPKEDAIIYLKKLIDEGNEVYIVTSSYYAGLTGKMENCLFKWFPYIDWENVIICKHKELIECDVMIDDGEHNLVNSKAHTKILFDTPHGHTMPWRNDFIRMSSWKDIYELLSCKIHFI